MKNVNLIAVLLLLATSMTNSAFVEIQEPEKVDQKDFATFLSYFDRVNAPYTYSEKLEKPKVSSESQLRNRYISRDLISKFVHEKQKSKFSRFQPMYTPILRYYPDEQTVAVIYKFGLSTEMYGVNIAFYDFKGNCKKIISSSKGKSNEQISIAFGDKSFEYDLDFTIHPNGNLTVYNFENVWEKDIKEFGIDDNKIVEKRLTEKLEYQLAFNEIKTYLDIKKDELQLASRAD